MRRVYVNDGSEDNNYDSSDRNGAGFLSISERENPRGFSPWDESELFFKK